MIRTALVSIPQAVSTVATDKLVAFDYCSIWRVSIPQAVSTVATIRMVNVMKSFTPSFNTASGKYCCNFMKWLNEKGATLAAFQYRKR